MASKAAIFETKPVSISSKRESLKCCENKNFCGKKNLNFFEVFVFRSVYSDGATERRKTQYRRLYKLNSKNLEE